MIVLIIRAYVNRRAVPARILAAVAAGALIAGCGGGGGSTPPPATPPANSAGSAATPVVSNSGAGIQAATGSSGNGPTAGSVGSAPTGSFSSGEAGQVSRSSQGSFSASRSGSISSSQSPQIMSAAQAKQAQQQPNHATSPTTPVTKPPATSHQPSHQAAPPPVKPRTRIVIVNHIKRLTVYRTRIRFRTRTITRTITKTVTKTVAPQVPAGAYMPSKHPELAQRAFTVAGANIGCQLAPTGVRCGIEHRSWDPPAQPKSCKSTTWGNALALASKGLPAFSCGGSNPIDTAAKVIPSGWDTTLDGYTCQVRSFAVDCFNSKSNSGFTISRTGYSIY